MFDLFYFSFRLSFFIGEGKLEYFFISLKFMNEVFEFGYLSILFINSFLIWPFHFSNDLDPEHILIQTRNHLELKILKFLFFLFDEVFQLLNLRHESCGIIGEIHLQFFIFLIQLGIDLSQLLIFCSNVLVLLL